MYILLTYSIRKKKKKDRGSNTLWVETAHFLLSVIISFIITTGMKTLREKLIERCTAIGEGMAACINAFSNKTGMEVWDDDKPIIRPKTDTIQQGDKISKEELGTIVEDLEERLATAIEMVRKLKAGIRE